MSILEKALKEMGDEWGGSCQSSEEHGGKLVNYMRLRNQAEEEEEGGKDTISFDMPLLIRVFELVREDIKDDAELHKLVDNLLDMGIDGRTLTMDDYENISHFEKGEDDYSDGEDEYSGEDDYSDEMGSGEQDPNERISIESLMFAEGKFGHTQPKTQNERKRSGDKSVRAKRNAKNLPNDRDDKDVHIEKNWKKFRKTKYKPTLTKKGTTQEAGK